MRTAEADLYRFLPTLGELDLHLLNEGRHLRLWRVLGAHPRVHQGFAGTSFAVFAPHARAVAVAGDFNGWDADRHPLRSLGPSGVWELFLPGVGPGARYRLAIRTLDDRLLTRADPMALATEPPPGTASIVSATEHRWSDGDWMRRRGLADPRDGPMSIYEVHLGSWRRDAGAGAGPGVTYGELARTLPEHVERLGFTHVELMPVMEHPFDGSWGYQVSSYFAPSARFGTPDGLRALIEALHERNLGVILDWVPAHFAADEWALAGFDGEPLYECEGGHRRWGTPAFDLARNEVRNFLVASALFWLEEFHADGLRVDGVSSLLYEDYDRDSGDWLPGPLENRPSLLSAGFLRELTDSVHQALPGTMLIAEESTAWPGVTRPTEAGGLGFDLKWNLGWMHDTLTHLATEPARRRERQDLLTFGLLYAFSESFVLPLSHDEVAQGKGSLLAKLPGDLRARLAGLRALYAWMWAHPGKQLLFMGGELAQPAEWDHRTELDWALAEQPGHQGVAELVRELNAIYRDEPALWERDADPAGFRWIEPGGAESGVISFLRLAADGRRSLACVANLSPGAVAGHRVGLPRAGRWRRVLSTDEERFGGAGPAGSEGVEAVEEPRHDLPSSAVIDLPPISVIWLSSPAEPAP